MTTVLTTLPRSLLSSFRYSLFFPFFCLFVILPLAPSLQAKIFWYQARTLAFLCPLFYPSCQPPLLFLLFLFSSFFCFFTFVPLIDSLQVACNEHHQKVTNTAWKFGFFFLLAFFSFNFSQLTTSQCLHDSTALLLHPVVNFFSDQYISWRPL